MLRSILVGLLVMSAVGFNAWIDVPTCMSCVLPVADPTDSFPSVTPADLLATNMAAEPITHIHFPRSGGVKSMAQCFTI